MPRDGGLGGGGHPVPGLCPHQGGQPPGPHPAARGRPRGCRGAGEVLLRRRGGRGPRHLRRPRHRRPRVQVTTSLFTQFITIAIFQLNIELLSAANNISCTQAGRAAGRGQWRAGGGLLPSGDDQQPPGALALTGGLQAHGGRPAQARDHAARHRPRPGPGPRGGGRQGGGHGDGGDGGGGHQAEGL